MPSHLVLDASLVLSVSHCGTWGKVFSQSLGFPTFTEWERPKVPEEGPYTPTHPALPQTSPAVLVPGLDLRVSEVE